MSYSFFSGYGRDEAFPQDTDLSVCHEAMGKDIMVKMLRERNTTVVESFTELYVHNELKQRGKTVYYHSVANSTIEIDFIVQAEDIICPIEVKEEENVKSKSLRTFIQNNPELKGIRISMKSRKEQDWLLNLPLYDFKYDL